MNGKEISEKVEKVKKDRNIEENSVIVII